MKIQNLFPALSIMYLMMALLSCEKNNNENSGRIEIIENDIPYKTDKYLRIGYMLKTWEYEKDGLRLERIEVFDYDTGSELINFGKSELPKIYKDPLKSIWSFISYDKITNYYLSIQLPLPLNYNVPDNILNRFIFTDTINNRELSVEGGVFKTRKDEIPRAIGSPVKGKNLIFTNLSGMAYHFDEVIFTNGIMNISERYAFDAIQLNDQRQILEGDPATNEAFFCYADTLYAVANGTVVSIKDGRPEQSGVSRVVTLNSMDELFGNYIVLDIGKSSYALYAHCIPGSFFVKAGSSIKEGQPIGLLGNSGNSTFAHLHFQLYDNKDYFLGKGLPFVLKNYTKTGELGNPDPLTPALFTNTCVENNVILSLE